MNQTEAPRPAAVRAPRSPRPPGLVAEVVGSRRAAVATATAVALLGGLATTSVLIVVRLALIGDRPASQLAWAFGGLCLAVLVTGAASQAVLVRAAQQGILRLRLELCHRILDTRLRRLEELGGPRLLAGLTDDVLAVGEALSSLPVLCLNLAVVTGTLGYLAWLSWRLFVLLAAFVVIGVVSYELVARPALRFLGKARSDQDELYRRFRSLTDGAKELKLNCDRRVAFLNVTLRGTATSLSRHSVLGLSLYGVASSWGQFLFFAFIGLVLLSPARGGIASGAAAGYVVAVLYLMGPLGGILVALPTLGRARVALRSLDALGLALRPDERPRGPCTGAGETHWGRLDLAGVTYGYRGDGEDEGFRLGPLDLTLRPGEVVFVTGGNGSGKTTLGKLLTGLYVPQAGQVRVDGEPVIEQTRERYRQRFAAVFADCHVFDRLVGPETDGELDRRAATQLARLQLDRQVRVDGGVLSTTALSTGQRKRLALLAAWLEDRPIYVFDEWAADQDPTFKRLFYMELVPGLRAEGKAVVVISHDDRYFHVADRVLRLEEGCLCQAEWS